jgi:Flp pilus assembly protein TadG
MARRLAPSLRRMADDRSGATALVTGLLLTVVLGFVAFGVDMGGAYAARRAAQNAADSAAFSGAAGLMAGATNTTDQSRAVAARYGLAHGAGGVTVSVNTPPTSGTHTTSPGAVEVIITRPLQRFFSGVFSKQAATIRARAVAVAGSAGEGCVVAFNPTAHAAVLLNGQPNINLAGCSLYANSIANDALSLNGQAILTAKSVELVGGSFTNGQAKIIGPIHTGVAPMADPYADVAVPTYAGCNWNGQPINGGVTKRFTPVGGAPFVFCGGLTINSSANVTFDPGVYIIDGGTLIINGGAVIRGTGVTFVLTGRSGTYATVTINGNADIQLSAPTSGPTAGLVFFQDRRAPTGGYPNIFNGGSAQVFTGALYFPKQGVRFNGGTSLTSGGCTQILADQIDFNGNARVGINCAGAGVRGVGGYVTALVE